MKTLLSLVLLMSSSAFAWGPTGHRVVGEIAEKHVKIETLVQLKKLLKGQSLSRVANWPDEIKSEPQNYSHTYNWHYTDWKDDQETHDHDHNSGKLIPAIEEQITTLKDQNKTDAEKEFAIKFLVHLIGDLHQPLHVGNGVDQGGNYCKVIFQNQVTNLHKLWDEDMINFTLLSFSEFTNFLQQTYGMKTNEMKQGQIMDWVIESKVLRNQIYPKPVYQVPDSAVSQITYCMRPYSDDQTKLPKLSYEYSYQWVPVVEKRLYQGGVRLAKVLDDIFAP